ncbi:hypothetical protein WJX77_008646 [Trebouxia sp. C0004]
MSKEMSTVPAGRQAPQTPSLRATEMPSVPQSASRQISWEVHLQQYLQKCAPLSEDKVSCLTGAVHKQPHLPEPWWSVIQHAESQQAACQPDSKPHDKRQGLAMLQLYEWATKQVPREGNYDNIVFLKLWIGYAKQQWSQNGQDEGRDAFKSLKNQQIADKSALLYLQWADLELKSGNTNKAIKQLKTGIKESAEPVRQLEDMLIRLQPQGTSTRAADGLHDSEANTATLHETTQRLHGQHLSGQTEGAEGSAFMTPAGARYPQGQSPMNGANDSLHQGMSSRRIGHNSKPLFGHNAGATETLVINPKAGLQSRPVAYAAATTASNMTYHSTSSGSTISESECTTATLHSHPKMACTNMTSRSISSHGSSHSGEETQTLHDKTLSGGPLGGEGTIQINQSLAHQSRPASMLVQQSFASAFKRDRSVGPKRTGLGGGAARVPMAMRAVPINAVPAEASVAPSNVMGPPRALPMAKVEEPENLDVHESTAARGSRTAISSERVHRQEAEARETIQVDNSKKRKADGEARQSPEVATAVAGIASKRRASPEAQARSQRPCSPQHRAAAVTASTALHGAAPVLHEASDQAAGRQLPAVEEADEDEPETMPLLARRVMAGRQSIIPGHQKAANQPGAQKAVASGGSSQVQSANVTQQGLVPDFGRSALEAGSARTSSNLKPPMRRAPAPPPPLTASALPTAAPVAPTSAAAPAKVAAGTTSSQAEASGSDRDAAAIADASSAMQQGAADKSKDAAKANAQGRVVMGPPPTKTRQPLAPLQQHQQLSHCEERPPLQQQQSSSQAAQSMAEPQLAQTRQSAEGRPAHVARSTDQPQQQQQQQRRRVREDENTVIVRGNRYTKLECVGRGGSSKVFKVMAPNRKIFALKRIKLQGKDSEASKGFVDEITLLQRLRGKQNIIQLVDAEVIQAEGTIYMVLEYGDIDLARLLAKHEQARREGGGADELDENFIRLYWQQMLQAVQTIHEARIVHSDLKPANFLMVEGQLKLIDFGIAKAISSDTTSIARESQVGTLNYMSPEAILGGTNNIRGAPPMKVGRASDVWSLGCILYQMVYGHTPFSALAFIQKMHAITDPGYRIAFAPIKNAALADTIKRCLDRSPRTRIQMQELLDHAFLRPTEGPARPAPGQVGLTRDQLKKLLTQVAEASASGADLDTLSEELFRQLSSRQTVNLGTMFRPTKPGPGLESAGAEPSKPQATPAQQQQHLQRAAQAISAAAAAAAVNQGTTPAVLLGTNDQSGGGQLEGAPAASVSGLIRVASEAAPPVVPRASSSATTRTTSSECRSNGAHALPSEADLERQVGRLRKVQAQSAAPRSAQSVDPLIAALQQGIAKMAVHSIATDNTTGSTETWQTCTDIQ